MATVFEPIRPVPPMTTIFMVYPSLLMTGDPQRSAEPLYGSSEPCSLGRTTGAVASSGQSVADRALRCAKGSAPALSIVTFENIRDSDICIWWTDNMQAQYRDDIPLPVRDYAPRGFRGVFRVTG